MKIISKGSVPTKLVPVKVTWRARGGKFVDQSNGEKTIRALTKALGSLIPKRGEPNDGMQYFVKGPHIYLDTFKETAVAGRATYQAKGRALVGRQHMPTDSHSEDIHSFEVTFKTKEDKNKMPDIEIVSGDIVPLPRGSKLVP